MNVELSVVGSIASVIALIAMGIGGVIQLFRKCRIYRSERDKRADKFRDFLVRVVDESTTANERSDVSALIQHTLSICRNKIIQQYCELITSLVIGGFGFLIASSMHAGIIAWVFLLLRILFSTVDLWFISTMRKDVEHSEWQIGEAWAGYFEKAHSRKSSLSNG